MLADKMRMGVGEAGGSCCVSHPLPDHRQFAATKQTDNTILILIYRHIRYTNKEKEEKERKRERNERKREKNRKKREIEKKRERKCPGSIIINLHSILKKKNLIYWQKCSKSQKVACGSIYIYNSPPSL